MSRKILSLDIQEQGVFALLIENSLKGNSIQAWHDAPFPGPGKAGEDPPAASPVQDALKQCIEACGLSSMSGVEAVVSISPAWISYRNLQMPFRDMKKIRQVLPFELEPALPFPVEEVTLDFQPLPRKEKADVLVGSVPTAQLNHLVEDLKAVGVAPHRVAPAGMAAALCLAKLDPDAVDFLFIHAQSAFATIFAVSDRQVAMARSLYAPTTGDQARKLASAAMQVMGAFEASFVSPFAPEKVVFSGASMDMDALLSEMGGLLDMPAVLLDLPNAVDLNIRMPDGPAPAPSAMNAALGLAVVDIQGWRTLNFYGSRSVIKKYWEEYRNDIIRTGALATLAAAIAVFNVLVEAHHLQKEISKKNQQIAFIFQSTFPDVQKIVDPLQQMRARLQEEREKNLFTGEMASEILNIDILNEISTRIPNELDVALVSLVRGDSSLLISGHTGSFNTVDDIKGRLERVPGFKAITINSANLEKATNRVQFKLKIDL